MSYLRFDKKELVNLEYSLSREMLSTNRAGGYSSTTIIGCNTRKYHGWLVCPIEKFNGVNHVLLSSVDESVIQHGQSFNLGIRKYSDFYEPKGHKYIVDFEYEPVLTLVYRVGGVVLKKEILVVHDNEQIMIRYTLLDAHSPTLLRLKPLLAFRSIHSLCVANMAINKQYGVVTNGISSQLYEGFPSLYIQTNKKNEFVPSPDWYYGVEYIREKERGYESSEDLYTPGYFELPIEKGESIILSASLTMENTKTFTGSFEKQVAARPPKNTFVEVLKNTANQFIFRKEKKTEIVAGYPWYGTRSRDTFISLPGLTLSLNKDIKTCKAVLDTISATLKDGLFPRILNTEHLEYYDVDTPLWYFWTLQKYGEAVGNKKSIWKDYGKHMKSILKSYKGGANFYIHMHENGLIWAEQQGQTHTWMDAMVDGKAVVPRYGYMVEVNALWYNAICYTLELAKENKDMEFVNEWKDVPQKIEESFLPVFWLETEKYLVDYVDSKGKSRSIRPNQLIATSLPYSPVNDEIKEEVLNAIELDLLTPKGIRTLSPKNPRYIGRYEGDQTARDNAAYRGSVWVWLLGHYIEVNFKLHGKSFLTEAERIAERFNEEMVDYGICSIPEVFDGDPPYNRGGAISQAWSVAEVLRIMSLIEEYKN